MRRIAAARFADGWVRELSSRPPVMLFLGARVSHEVKCFSVGQRVMSVPISAISLSAVWAPDPVNLREVDAARQVKQRRAAGRTGGRCSWASCGGGAAPARARPARRRGGERSGGGLQWSCRTARSAPGRRRRASRFCCKTKRCPGDSGRSARRRSRPAVAWQRGSRCWARRSGSRWPATMSRRMRRPVAPVMSLTTSGNWRFICDEGFLHPLGEGARRLDEGLAVAQIRAQRHDPRRRPKAAPEQADAVQLAQPLAIRHITLPAGDILEVPRVHEQDLEAARFEDLVDRDPIDAGRFHRHARHATRGEPVGEADADRCVNVENACDRGRDRDRAGRRRSARRIRNRCRPHAD